MTIKETEKLVKMLIKNKVEEFQNEGTRIKLSPLAFITKGRPSPKSEDTGTPEDDLFYSATNFKTKAS